MKTIWLTDIHLDFLGREQVERFAQKVRNEGAEAVLITGDIGQAPSVTRCLRYLAAIVEAPIYFVLGNHDYYHGSIAEVRASIRRLCREVDKLHWLNDSGVVELRPGVCLIGHDSWGDGRCGDFHGSDVRLNDFVLIQELNGCWGEALLSRLMALGDEAAAHFRRVLPEALKVAEHVVVMTHVPPFAEAAWHEGRRSDDNWLPFFACKAVGDVLREFMREHPLQRMTVLCGHTHGGGVAQVLPNLRVVTGGAEYGRPVIQSMKGIAE